MNYTLCVWIASDVRYALSLRMYREINQYSLGVFSV